MSWRAHGMRTWLLQRLTAVYMLLYLIGLTIVIARLPAIDFTVWRQLFVSPFANISAGLFFFSILAHAWVGVRDILIDYVHRSSLRFLLWVVISLGLIALGLWVSMILYSVVVL
jgi:succinate dehydrogenase / fumarate reductase membrane anchor subunit